MSILMVDDSPNVISMLSAFLKAAGHTELLAAGSASDAFKHLGMEYPGSIALEVDLILMDVTMPEMDGVEACRRVKATEHLRDIPIIMVTGNAEVETLEEAFAAGAMDYITKPLNKVELLARVGSALALKREMDCRKLAYRELEEASLAKTQILSTVTHELKTPLSSIVGYVDRMLQKQETVGPLNERQTRYLETVQKSARQLKALIDDLLDISRIEAGNVQLSLESLALRPEIEEVIRSLQNQIDEKQIALVLNIPSDPCQIEADRLRFSQIMTNLLSNACKYSPAEATVTITAKEEAGLIQIDVADTGIGISKVDQSRLFTKFFRVDNSATREVPGSGLGLYITRHLIEAHGGKIWVSSEVGRGSTFSLSLRRGESVLGRDIPAEGSG